MGVRSFLFLTLLSFFAYFGNICAEHSANPDGRGPHQDNEERALFNLGKLKSLLKRNPKNLPNLRENPSFIKQADCLANDPAIQKGIKSIKENPELMKQVKSLSKDPNFVKSMQTSPSLKAVRQVEKHLSRGQQETMSPNEGK
ncbi:hypothetical protein GN958_ATG18748 [Phytophthora infestans]|uniref:Secreted RxLR effector peptide protein n=1 Tax=Phytophthora infestans TaxID=4787 RepID=A0A8S9U1P5_PHYIN|nr:hypothetical protein GN958_ATG18748 [Phytophthora infestans]